MTGPGPRPRPARAIHDIERIPALWLALTSMIAWQIGSAASVGLVEAVGAAGAGWLRLVIGSIVFIAIGRPRIRGRSRGDLAMALALGACTGWMSIFFLAAIELIPLGTAIALGFMGPFALAAFGARGLRRLVWPVLGLAGVIALTEPWTGEVNLLGVALALANGGTWALYISLNARVGARFAGVEGLSITLPVAAVSIAVFGIPQVAGHLTPGVLAMAVGISMLVPVVPYALDLLSLRRISTAAFGTLMALHPALGALTGLLLLGQPIAPLQALGTALVVIAGIGAMRADAGRHGATADAPLPELAV